MAKTRGDILRGSLSFGRYDGILLVQVCEKYAGRSVRLRHLETDIYRGCRSRRGLLPPRIHRAYGFEPETVDEVALGVVRDVERQV